MRRQGLGRGLYSLGEPYKGFDQVNFLRRLQASCGVGLPLNFTHALAGRLAQDAGNAGMHVLDIVNRIVIGLLLGHFQVEVQRAAIIPCQENEAGGIRAHFLDHILEGDKLAGPRGHGHRLAGTQQVDQLHQDDMELIAALPGI